MDTVQICEVMGSEVRGLDASRPLRDEEVQGLRVAYDESHMVLLRGQQLSRAEMARFVGYFWPIHRWLIAG